MNRRDFIGSLALSALASAVLPLTGATAAEKAGPAPWPIGCFNRPWVEGKQWNYEVALAGIKEAGYALTGLLSRSASEPLLDSDATQEYLVSLKRRITALGLKPNVGALRIKEDLPLIEQIKDTRQQIENGKVIGVEFLLTFGVDKPAHFENYFKLMHDASAYAADLGMKVVLKPHGGASGASEEITHCLEKVRHENFKIWFDAGNIIHYTGKDPVEQLKPIIQHVTGFCAKDCGQKGGTVWLGLGQGKVDFAGVFRELKRAGFHGPLMVECCAPGETPEAVTANARKAREYLQKVLDEL